MAQVIDRKASTHISRWHYNPILSDEAYDGMDCQIAPLQERNRSVKNIRY